MPDAQKVTALHRAAMGGHADCVQLLLAHGAAVDALDDMFYAPPLIWAAEGSTSKKSSSGTDFIAVIRLLLAAGPQVEWHPSDATPGRDRVVEVLADLRRAAGV